MFTNFSGKKKILNCKCQENFTLNCMKHFKNSFDKPKGEKLFIVYFRGYFKSTLNIRDHLSSSLKIYQAHLPKIKQTSPPQLKILKIKLSLNF